MKKTFIKTILVIVACTFYKETDAQTWMSVGVDPINQVNPSGESNSVMAIDPYWGGTYVAFADLFPGDELPRLTVKKYTGYQWTAVGSGKFSKGTPYDIRLAFSSSEPYVFYADGKDTLQATVKKYSNNTWTAVGAERFTSGKIKTKGLVIANGIPYIAYADLATPGTIQVMKFNGNNWEVVGSAFQGDVDMVKDANGLLYLSVRYGGHVTVKKLNNGTWETVGASAFIGDNYLGLFFWKNQPYLAYNSPYRLTMMKLKDGTWQLHSSLNCYGNPVSVEMLNTSSPMTISFVDYIGLRTFQYIEGPDLWIQGSNNIGFEYNPGKTILRNQYNIYAYSNTDNKSVIERVTNQLESLSKPDDVQSIYQPSVAVDKNGGAYLAFQDRYNSNRISVVKRISDSWSSVGIRGFSAGVPSKDLHLAVAGDNKLYVAYKDANSAVSVMQYNGGSWSALGSEAGNCKFAGNQVDLALGTSDIPYIAFPDKVNNKIIVKQFVGGSWQLVGQAVSDESANSPSLAFDAAGVPYVAYIEDTGSRVTVKRFMNGSWELAGNRSFTEDISGTPDLAFGVDGSMFVSYQSGGTNATVRKLIDGSWILVGTVKPSGSPISAPRLAIDGGGILYLTYLKGSKPYVSRFFNGAWRYLNGDILSDVSMSDVSIASKNNTTFVAYGDYGSFVKSATGPAIAMPANLRGNIGDKKISLKWDAVNGASYYRVYTMDEAGNSTSIGNSYSTQFSHSNLTDGKVYRYRVAAIAGSGEEGVFSAEASAMLLSGALSVNKAATNSQTVGLTISANNTDAQMCFSNDGTTWSEWEAYAAAKSWTLSPGDGNKTVYMKLRQTTIETSAYSASVMLDQAPPVISGVENGKYYNTNRIITFNEGTARLTRLGIAATSEISTGYSVNDDDSYKLTVTDAAGNETSVSFTIDKTAPGATLVTAVSGTNSAGYTREDKPTVKGTAEAGTSVILYLDNTVYETGRVTADENGFWSFTFASSISEKAHSITAEAIDAAGNSSGVSQPLNFTIDRTSPDTPLILAIAGKNAADYTQQTKPFISGTAEASATVKLFRDGIAIGDTQVTSEGTWSYTLTSNLEESITAYFFTAITIDKAGNQSPVSAAMPVKVDRTAPAVPLIKSLSGINAAGYTSQGKPTVGGSAEAGSLVSLYLNGSKTRLTSITVRPDGTWSYQFVTELENGSYSIKAAATDPADNTSENSAEFKFFVDKIVPVTTITSLSGLNNGFTKESKPTVSGTSKPNAKVSLFLDGSATRLVDITANASGEWSYTFTSELYGPRSLKASATDVAGNVGALSAAFNFTIDKTAPVTTITSLSGLNNGFIREARPTVSGNSEANAKVSLFLNGGSGSLADVTADANGKWTHTFTSDLSPGAYSLRASGTDLAGNTGALSTVLSFSVDRTAPAAPRIVTVGGKNTGAYIKTGKPEVAGTAEESTTIDIFVDGSTTKTASLTAPQSGVWYYTFTADLQEGEHTIVAIATDQAGNASIASDAFRMVIDKTAPSTTITSISGLNERGYTSQVKPTVSGATEPNTMVSLYLDAGMIKLGDVTSDANGIWKYIFVSPLSEAEHKVMAAAIDKAGNTSATMASFAFHVDKTAPKVPLFSLQINAAGYYNGKRPSVSGTVEPGDRLRILIKDHPDLTTDFVSSMGKVTNVIFPRELPEGPYTFTAVAVDDADNISPVSESRSIIIDVTAPSAPVITSVSGLTAAGYTSQVKPALSGTTEAHAAVTLYLDGSPAKLASVKADAKGLWSYTFPLALPEGSHSITAKATDLADNTGVLSAAFHFTVDVTIQKPFIGKVSGMTSSGHTNQIRPVISGTADNDAVISIYLDGAAEESTVTANAAGTWDFTFSHALSEAAHVLKVKAKDAAGNERESDLLSFTVDATAPAVPVVTEIPGGTGLTADPAALTKGKSEPGTIVEIYAGNDKADEVLADADGQWTLFFDPVLSLGLHEFTAVAVDKAGNRSQPGTPVTIKVISEKIVTILNTASTEAKTYGDKDFIIAASSNNDQSPVRYSSSNSKVLTVSDNGTVHIAGAGTASITISQAASPAFTSSSIIREIVVKKAKQTIYYSSVPALERHGEVFDLDAYASSELPVLIKTSNPMVIKVKEGKLEPQGIGRAIVSLSVADTANYLPVNVDIDIHVADQSGEKVIVGKVLSPNGDGINDVLKIEGLTSLGRHRILIFNREGTPVFKSEFYPSGEVSEENPKGFTGSFKVNSLPQGTYFYKVEYKDGNVQKRKTGYLVVKY